MKQIVFHQDKSTACRTVQFLKKEKQEKSVWIMMLVQILLAYR